MQEASFREGARMRIDRIADPLLMLAEVYNRQDVGWRERTPRRFLVGNDKPARKAISRKLGAIGQLEISLTRNKRDLRRLQELRYQVFYEHGGAIASSAARRSRRDRDDFDSICDHLMVVDRGRSNAIADRPPVVGTYRLLRQDVAESQGGFYSAEEFDLSGLVARHAGLRFLELGRSCVLPAYRRRRTIELLWHGVWSYAREHQIDVMIGCGSFESVDAARLARPLSFLHHFARAPKPWRAAAHQLRRIDMNQIAKSEIDIKAAWRELPPLIKGYLRVGAFVGDGAVIDPTFGTTDVLIVLPVKAINTRYINHFGVDAQRYAAA